MMRFGKFISKVIHYFFLSLPLFKAWVISSLNWYFSLFNAASLDWCCSASLVYLVISSLLCMISLDVLLTTLDDWPLAWNNCFWKKQQLPLWSHVQLQAITCVSPMSNLTSHSLLLKVGTFPLPILIRYFIFFFLESSMAWFSSSFFKITASISFFIDNTNTRCNASFFAISVSYFSSYSQCFSITVTLIFLTNCTLLNDCFWKTAKFFSASFCHKTDYDSATRSCSNDICMEILAALLSIWTLLLLVCTSYFI